MTHPLSAARYTLEGTVLAVRLEPDEGRPGGALGEVTACAECFP